MLNKLILRFLVNRWARKAMQFYGCTGMREALFNTACFTHAVGETLPSGCSSSMAESLLVDHGYVAGQGGCHWFRSSEAVKQFYGRGK